MLPSERDANAAASSFARKFLNADEKRRLKSSRRFARLVADDPGPKDHVLDDTVAALRSADDAFLPQLTADHRARELESMDANARNWPADMINADSHIADVVVVRPFDWRKLFADSLR
jgi:hypothetical protein